MREGWWWWLGRGLGREGCLSLLASGAEEAVGSDAQRPGREVATQASPRFPLCSLRRAAHSPGAGSVLPTIPLALVSPPRPEVPVSSPSPGPAHAPGCQGCRPRAPARRAPTRPAAASASRAQPRHAGAGATRGWPRRRAGGGGGGGRKARGGGRREEEEINK